MKVISLGLGVQSTAMYLMSSKNMIERADHAIFADPGAESTRTYEILEYLQDWAKYNDGIPIHVTNEKNLYKGLLENKSYTGRRAVLVPAFTGNGTGMLMRQCTPDYKIFPVLQTIRKIQGIKPRKRMKPVDIWLGISLDEIERMKISQQSNLTYVYPLIDGRMTRGDCLRIFKRYNFPIPPKSSCVFCPYHSDKHWKDMKDNSRKDWEIAVQVDDEIRWNTKLREPIYLHRSCVPLKNVQFADQQELFMCEEGFCGL